MAFIWHWTNSRRQVSKSYEEYMLFVIDLFHVEIQANFSTHLFIS
jgi:hypothetical protein